jgi:RND family efflux transporter MFP subunit
MSLDEKALAALRRTGEPAADVYETRSDRRRRLWRIAAAAAAVVILAWLAASLLRATQVEVATAEPAEEPGATTVLNASGYVVARRLATVSSKVTGRIESVLFEEGVSVEAGRELARLDSAAALAVFRVAERQQDAARRQLTETEVRLAEAVRERDRARALKVENLVSQSAVDAAEAEAAALAARLDSARAELAVAAAGVRVRAQDLDDLVIRAPFAGVILSKDAQPGEMVSPISAGGGFTRTGIATLVDMDSREIEVDVNEAYINRVHDGQRAEAALDAYPDWRIPCRVTAIVPAADRQKATVRVRIGIDELDPRILPDMGVKVRFFGEQTTDGRGTLARVPVAAVVESEGGTHVFVVEEARARRRSVALGAERDGLRDVLEGVQPGESVVLKPPTGLDDGDRVRVQPGS